MRDGVQERSNVDHGLHSTVMGQLGYCFGIGAPAQIGLYSHEHHGSASGLWIDQIGEVVFWPVDPPVPVSCASCLGPCLGKVIELLRIELGELGRLEFSLHEPDGTGSTLSCISPSTKCDQQGVELNFGGLVNGKKIQTDVKATFLTSAPADAFTLGLDGGSLVGDYGQANGLKGKIADFRLYWGILEKETLEGWANPK